MKPKYRTSIAQGKGSVSDFLTKSPLKTAAALLLVTGGISTAATITWKNSPAVGDFNTGVNWDTGNVPGVLDPADIAKVNNTGTALGGTTVTYASGDNFTFATLELASATAQDSNKPVFNQTGGTLSVGTLRVGLAASGGSKSPEYHLSGGVLNITSGWSFGNGSTIKFLASGGTLNYSGSPLTIGRNGVAHELTLTNSAELKYNTANELTFGSSPGSIAKVSLANTSSFTASSLGTLLMGNGESRGNFISLADSATFSAPLATIALSQWNNGVATIPTVAAGTITLGGTSLFQANIIKTGGNNTVNPQWGVVNLNGGTIETNSIQIGSSSTPADATHNVVNANGGTVKALSDTSSFFSGVFVNLFSGGLKFNTTDKFVTIVNSLSGTGGLTKLGTGTLTLSSGSLTYAGNTVVSEGTLSLTVGTLPDTANVSIAGGDVAKLDLAHGFEDAIGTLTLGGTLKSNGVYGSSSSPAPIENQDDTYFTGTGTVRVGPPTATPRNLVWEGLLGQAWSTWEFDTNFLDGATQVGFKTFDHVAFGNVTNADEGINQRALFISGAVQPASITFNNDTGFDYTVAGGTIGGTTGVVKNGTGTVSLGGSTSSYTGPISVNAGRLVLGENKGFGSNSGITIANLAQVDINGKSPGTNFTYTLAGTGPEGPGTGQIVNSGANVINSGGVGSIVLTADASIGNDGERFDIGSGGGTLTGNSHTLTKVGNNGMAFRGNASGSPIHIIVAGGSIFSEGTDAFGGATGTLTIKNGARAGSFGALTITTPSTIESGGTINNLGNGKGTWSGPISVTGNVTLEGGATAPDQLDITGTITGTANITKAGTALVTIAHPTHVGNTTVNGGQLALSNAELSNSGSVSIASAATLDLPHGLEDTVGTLFLDGVQVAAGVYGATGNLTAQFATDRIVGAGKLNVLNGPSAGGAFGIWADANITDPANAALKGRNDDPDHDGFNNLQEFLFGTSPETTTGSLTSLTRSDSDLVLHWNERADAIYILQESTTMAENPWPTSLVAPVVGDQSGVPAGYSRKQATVPVDSPHKFIRVRGLEN